MFKKYDAYKDSGVEWVDQIPNDWLIKKAFLYFDATKGKNASQLTKEYCGLNEGSYPVYSGQTENDGVMGEINNFEFDFSQNGCLFSTTVGAKAMTLRFLKHQFSLSQNCMIITNRKLDEVYTKFYYYAFQPMFEYYRNLIPDHMQASFRMEDFFQYKFLLPTYLEQNQITEFLDQKTSEIDQAIAIKEQQIALLNERKQIVIQKAVTQGLNPNVAMKDSGVEWIGQIPEHWNVDRLGTILEPISKKGHADKQLLSITREKGVIVRDVEDDSENHNFIPDDLTNYKLIEAGQFGMNKMKAWQGSYGVSAYTGIVSPAYYIFRFIKPIYPEFFHWAIRSKLYVSFFGSASDGVRVGQWDLSKDRMKQIPFVFPSLEQQKTIADYLTQQSELISEGIKQYSAQIEKLKEYKTTLINDAVTGKIKVA